MAIPNRATKWLPVEYIDEDGLCIPKEELLKHHYKIIKTEKNETYNHKGDKIIGTVNTVKTYGKKAEQCKLF